MSRKYRCQVGSRAARGAWALVPMLLAGMGCVMSGLAMPTLSEMKVVSFDVVVLVDQQPNRSLVEEGGLFAPLY